MKNKIYVILGILFIGLVVFFLPRIICGPSNDYCVYTNSTAVVNPGIGLLWPLFLLSIFVLMLKNISFKNYFLTLCIYLVVSTLILSQIAPDCSAIVCFFRNQLAPIFSILFSLIYFIILLFLNRKNKPSA